MKKLLFIVLLLLLATTPLFAQDDDPLQNLCTPEAKQAIADALLDLSGNFTTMEDADVEAALFNLQVVFASYRAQCTDGLVFTSDDYGFDVVTDPIIFPDNIYRVTFEAESFASASLEAMDGDCGLFPLIQVTDFDGGSDQEVFELEGCMALIQVDSSAGWSLTFEPIAP